MFNIIHVISTALCPELTALNIQLYHPTHSSGHSPEVKYYCLAQCYRQGAGVPEKYNSLSRLNSLHEACRERFKQRYPHHTSVQSPDYPTHPPIWFPLCLESRHRHLFKTLSFLFSYYFCDNIVDNSFNVLLVYKIMELHHYQSAPDHCS